MLCTRDAPYANFGFRLLTVDQRVTASSFFHSFIHLFIFFYFVFDLQEWARDEALARNVREAKGLPVEYGQIYSQEPK